MQAISSHILRAGYARRLFQSQPSLQVRLGKLNPYTLVHKLFLKTKNELKNRSELVQQNLCLIQQENRQ